MNVSDLFLPASFLIGIPAAGTVIYNVAVRSFRRSEVESIEQADKKLGNQRPGKMFTVKNQQTGHQL